MRAIAVLVSALALVSAIMIVSPAPAAAGTYVGTVTHVSSANIKVKDNAGTETSFLLAPSFDQVFSSDGKTTYQMSRLTPGTPVKITYHSALGVKYCDKINVLHH